MTLGERLAADGRRLVAGRTWQPPPVLALRPLLARVAALPTPATQRYRRVEAPTGFEAAPGEPLPAVVQEQLRGLVGPAVAAMRVHHDAAADTFARTRDADAVAVGTDVYFRTGRYRPYDRDGLALIAHEATHVDESAVTAATWRRATGRGVADEEHAAQRVERQVAGPAVAPIAPRPVSVTPVVPLVPRPVPVTPVVPAPVSHGPVAPPPVTPPPVTPPPAPTPDRAAGRGHVMTAAAGRDTEAVDAVPGVDFEELRRVLYRDLIGQLRVDFERGA
jgi:hypothetical protein